MTERGLTDAALAAEMRRRGYDVSRVAVHYWRTQQRVPRFQHAAALAEILETPLEALI